MFARLSKIGAIEDARLGIRWDRAALVRDIHRRAGMLLRLGIGPGSVVAIAHGGSARFFADLFAVWQVGAAAACLDPALKANELETVVRFADCAAVLVDGKPTHLAVPNVALDEADPAGASEVCAEVEPDHPALVLFTSGTTGVPKGVVLSFRVLSARIDANIAAIGKTALTRSLVTLPTHFGHGLIGNSLTPLLAGGDIFLHPLGPSLAADLGRIVDEHGITFMSSVPTLWRMATDRSREPTGGSLARIHVGSAPLPATLWSDVSTWSGAEVVNCYGITEAANWIAGASSRADGIADGLVGSTWGGRAGLIDRGGSIVERGEGEIVIAPPFLMDGYLKRDDLTKAAFHQGWFRTGDHGSIDSNGRIRLDGRIKDEINRAGFKIQPAEIDALLEAHPAVAEACAFAIPDPMSGEAVGVAVRPASGRSLDAGDLQAWCRERTRREAVPEKWFVVAEIPRTGRGKVSRDTVRRALMDDAGVASLTLPAPEPALEAPAAISGPGRNAVERAWVELFGRASWDAGVPLAQTDADSLDVLRLWLLIERSLGGRLSMDMLDFAMTPAELTREIEGQLDAAAQPPPRDGAAPTMPTVFFMLPAAGDSPAIARFRSSLEHKMRFVLIDYPAWNDMLDAGGGFDTLAEAAAAQISAQCREGDACLLAGFSFGGFVAMETARRLAQRGRRVDFVGLFDTNYAVFRTKRSFLVRAGRTLRSIFAAPGRLVRMAPRRIIVALLRMRAFALAKMLCRLAMMLPAKRAIEIEWEMIVQVRAMALRRLRFEPLAVPITLFRAAETPVDNVRFGWSERCSNLTMIGVGGEHLSLLEPPTLGHLTERFREAVESAYAKAQALELTPP